jgi:cell division septum initiation protein DivIVA
VQIENKGAPSFSHLGTHVASILEEAGKSSENMLADAAERAQEAIDAAEEEAAEIIKAAEHRAGEIEGEARRTLEEAQTEGARVEEEALQAAEDMRAQAEQDARTVLEEARDATDMIWQEAERERIGVEAETIRLETLRHRSLEQLGRVYGHLESVLDEVRAGIGRVEDETEDLDEATAAAAARLGVEPPASSPEESPRFPAPRDAKPREDEDDGDGLGLGDGDDADGLGLGDGDDADGLGQRDDDGGDGMLAATRPDTPPTPASTPGDAEATQPVPASGTSETTQPTLPGSAAETTQPDPAVAAETPPGPADGEGPAGDQDATQRLEPVGNAANQARSSRPAGAKDDKGQP